MVTWAQAGEHVHSVVRFIEAKKKSAVGTTGFGELSRAWWWNGEFPGFPGFPEMGVPHFSYGSFISIFVREKSEKDGWFGGSPISRLKILMLSKHRQLIGNEWGYIRGNLFSKQCVIWYGYPSPSSNMAGNGISQLENHRRKWWIFQHAMFDYPECSWGGNLQTHFFFLHGTDRKHGFPKDIWVQWWMFSWSLGLPLWRLSQA